MLPHHRLEATHNLPALLPPEIPLILPHLLQILLHGLQPRVNKFMLKLHFFFIPKHGHLLFEDGEEKRFLKIVVEGERGGKGCGEREELGKAEG